MKANRTFIYSFVASTLILTGCGSSGGGGTATPTLPSDAATINASNATGIATSAVATYDTVYAAIGIETTTLPSMKNVINKIKETAFNRNKQPINIVTGITDNLPCTNSGSISDTYNLTSTSDSGTLSFNSCNEGGIIFNGSFSYSYTWSNTTGDYNGTANGSLTMTVASNNFTVVIDISETGNDFSGAFSLTLSYSFSGVPGAGFLVTTETPLTGTGLFVTSGQLLVQGANNTRLRIIITSSSTADVYLDDGNGSFVLLTSNMAI